MMNVPTVAEMTAKGEAPEVLFWVGCAGSFDERAKRVTKAFVKILNAVGTKFAVLGTEETCTGDPARRAGNEFLFQMQAMNNITVLNGYNIKKIVTACPHCFNTLKNEYPELAKFKNVVFEVIPSKNHDASFTKKNWSDIDLEKSQDKYIMQFKNKQESYKVQVRPVLKGTELAKAEKEFDSDFTSYKETKSKLDLNLSFLGLI